MNGMPPLAILLFGIALGACLPILVTTLRARFRTWLGHRWFKPTMLRLDEVPSRRRQRSTPPTDAQL